MKLKVCGMREPGNIGDLIKVNPEYIGMIFYSKSPRFVNIPIIKIQEDILKVGVFVNESIPEILIKVKNYKLDLVQLHGDEPARTCIDLFRKNIKVIKAFSVDGSFDFDRLIEFEPYCELFLFDAMGKTPGGTGKHFNWGLLKHYKGTTSYFLSGGIDLCDVSALFEHREKDKRMTGVDINSKFEIRPAYKDIEKIKKFKKLLIDEKK
ncbi:MAG: phosphoribosylanthranilate isomerase [Bacteroidales bacterium]|nr:phosphoribosylanthranilate isomerase [Bacteroidales bacterium]